MAIEGIIGENSGLARNSQVSETKNNPFSSNIMIIAGNIKVKHPLMVDNPD